MFKHLHGRGEDFVAHEALARHAETPPRTWRRHIKGRCVDAMERNTSTDVEKTPKSAPSGSRIEKHLHGRGEDARRP